LTIPARVIASAGARALASIDGRSVEIDTTLLGPVAAGDWLLVHAGLALERIEPGEAAELVALRREWLSGDVDQNQEFPRATRRSLRDLKTAGLAARIADIAPPTSLLPLGEGQVEGVQGGAAPDSMPLSHERDADSVGRLGGEPGASYGGSDDG
jgi:hydrogenase expression/formation protein HypC